jgi:hypothetical protein
MNEAIRSAGELGSNRSQAFALIVISCRPPTKYIEGGVVHCKQKGANGRCNDLPESPCPKVRLVSSQAPQQSEVAFAVA